MLRFKYLSEIQGHTDNICRVDSAHKINKISYQIVGTFRFSKVSGLIPW